MSKYSEIVNKFIDEHSSEAVEFLQKLIQEPSVQGNEKSAQEIVIKKLNELGLKVDVWDPSWKELSEDPNFVASRDTYEGSPNVVGVLAGQGGGKSIILNGHIDVVPEGDRTKWNQDPFSGHIEDGKLYGRGTSDMKGGSVSLLFAVEAIVKSGIKLNGDVIFESVIEEESGGMGTLATLLRDYKADAALVPEPTNMKLFIKQQGSMWFRITVEGLSAHAGTRYEGVSAIEQAWKLHQGILKLEAKRNASISDPLYSHIPLPIPINVGKIQGGSWPSSVPDLVTMEGRIGVGPNENLEVVRQELKDAVAELCQSDEWLKDHPAKVEFFGAQWVPNAVERDHPFSEMVQKNFEAIYNKPPIVQASPWGTDGGLLGTRNIPALVIGPGETKLAHYPNEYIEIKEMIEAAKLFALTLITWCGVKEE